MPPHMPWWHRYHPARLLYLFLLGFPLTVIGNEVHTCLTVGPNALYDGDWDFAHLTNTWIVRFAVAQPLLFSVTLVASLILAYLGYRLDHRYRLPSGKLPLIRARDLDRTTFRMGDDAAASRPYTESIVDNAFVQAAAALRAAAERRSPKRGIVVLGESNAGKTRLALESLIAALPRWPVLVWSPTYSADAAPPAEGLRSRKLVIFVDDLPDYVATPTPIPGSSATSFQQSASLADPAATLRAVIAEVRTAVGKRGRTLLVVTCRDPEGLARAHLGLASIFDELDQVTVPTFADTEKGRVATALEVTAKTTRHWHLAASVREVDWDGTLGSLVLGLSTKQQEYEQLRAAGSLAVPVLHAMKLLARSGILAHTEPRLRAICGIVFGQSALRDDPALWQTALDDLTRLQFVNVTTDPNTYDTMLVIRKDPAYYDRVITAYPDPAQPQQLDRDRSKLLSLFTDLGDADAISSIGNMYFNHDNYAEALAAYDAALALGPIALGLGPIALGLGSRDAAVLKNKGVTLGKMGRLGEALDAFDAALTIAPADPDTFAEKGVTLTRLGRDKEALAAFEASLLWRPDDPGTLANKGDTLVRLGRFAEAFAAYEASLAWHPHDPSMLFSMGLALLQLGQYTEALVAFNAMLRLRPDDLAAQYYRDVAQGSLLHWLGHYAQALVAYDRALVLRSDDPELLFRKGNALFDVGRYEEALATYEASLCLRPNHPATLRNKDAALAELRRHEKASAVAADHSTTLADKGVALARQGRYAEALAAFKASLRLHPNDAATVSNAGAALFALGRLDDALADLARALALDPTYTDDWHAKALALDPTDFFGWRAKAAVLRTLGRTAEADVAEARAKELAGH